MQRKRRFKEWNFFLAQPITLYLPFDGVHPRLQWSKTMKLKVLKVGFFAENIHQGQRLEENSRFATVCLKLEFLSGDIDAYNSMKCQYQHSS